MDQCEKEDRIHYLGRTGLVAHGEEEGDDVEMDLAEQLESGN